MAGRQARCAGLEPAAINRVAEQRGADMGHVNPNLMGPSRLQRQPLEARPIAPLYVAKDVQGLEMRPSLPARTRR